MTRFVLIFSILFLAGLLPVYAQYNPDKINKKAKKYYEEAALKASNGDYKGSMALLQAALSADAGFADASLSMAGLFTELKQYDSAIFFYEKAQKLDSVYFNDYNITYSINLAGKGQFEKALQAIDRFITNPRLNETSVKAAAYRKKCYEFALQYQKEYQPDNTYRFNPVNLGEGVNSNVSEYYPCLIIEGTRLVYTRRVNSRNEDFYETVLQNNQWQQSGALTGNINTGNNEGAQTISQDGQWLIFTGCNFEDGFGSCDLYISYATPKGWSRPENLGQRINTEAWESAPSLSPDKRSLYFASNRPGGFGGSDIYVCTLLTDGRWSNPVNLGALVNTVGDESSPFIHTDNQSLYFTSNSHPGYGGDDLFITKKLPANQWSVPKNLGYPINTIENEGSLVVTANGKTAFYASDRAEGRGGLDIYQFELRSDIRPLRTLWIKGNVFDAKTKISLPSMLELTDLATREIISKVQTDENGNYLITLPIGSDYAFNVNRKGYLFYSENFSLKQKAPDSTYSIDIPLQPLEANAGIILKNIFFDVNKFDVKPESQIELDKVVQLLKDNPTVKIKINGHTDNIGKAKDNITLSNNRSKAVVAYLVSKGIVAARLSYQGLGATQPIASNSTEEGKAKNRRTELKVVGK
jgi:outer membrane protein OmpA-like peptidoglycan-associated protein